jgi:hypothetical protein
MPVSLDEVHQNPKVPMKQKTQHPSRPHLALRSLLLRPVVEVLVPIIFGFGAGGRFSLRGLLSRRRCCGGLAVRLGIFVDGVIPRIQACGAQTCQRYGWPYGLKAGLINIGI